MKSSELCVWLLLSSCCLACNDSDMCRLCKSPPGKVEANSFVTDELVNLLLRPLVKGLLSVKSSL